MNAAVHDPKAVFDFPLRKKTRHEKLERIFNLIRHYPTMDLENLSMTKFRGLNQFHIFDVIKFGRSFEYIKSFAMTSTIGKCYAAVVLNRKLQVYNFINRQMLFEINIPNAGALQEDSQVQCLFLDEDSILAVKDGKSRFTLINIKAQIEAYQLMNVKQK